MMKQTIANSVRTSYLEKLMAYFSEAGEDVGVIAGGTLNFPICTEDGAEGWIEIKVAVPKYEDEEGYELRNDYSAKQAEKIAKAEERAKAKAEKIARDKAAREAKKAQKEAEKTEQ